MTALLITSNNRSIRKYLEKRSFFNNGASSLLPSAIRFRKEVIKYTNGVENRDESYFLIANQGGEENCHIANEARQQLHLCYSVFMVVIATLPPTRSPCATGSTLLG